MTFTHRDLATPGRLSCARPRGRRSCRASAAWSAGAVRTKSGAARPRHRSPTRRPSRDHGRPAARSFPGCAGGRRGGRRADPALLAAARRRRSGLRRRPGRRHGQLRRGLPLFGVMAAAIMRGEVVAAAIHDPVGDDMALALRGEGAWRETADGHAADAARRRAGAGRRDDRQRRPGAICRRDAARRWSAPTCRAWRRSGTSAAPAHQYRMVAAGQHSTSVVQPAACPGITRPAGCCIGRPAATRRDSTTARTGRAHLSGGMICAPDRKPAGWPCARHCISRLCPRAARGRRPRPLSLRVPAGLVCGDAPRCRTGTPSRMAT